MSVSPKSRRAVGVCAVAVFLAVVGDLWAQPSPSPRDMQEAVTVTGVAVRDLDVGNFQNLYANGTSPNFKRYMSYPAFAQQLNAIKYQIGAAPYNRQLLTQSVVGQLQVGAGMVHGIFIFIRYRAMYPGGVAFEDFYLERVGQTWRIVGLWITPGY